MLVFWDGVGGGKDHTKSKEREEEDGKQIPETTGRRSSSSNRNAKRSSRPTLQRNKHEVDRGPREFEPPYSGRGLP